MKIINRKFSREYREIESFEAGLVLTGGEVKSVRNGGLKLDDAFVRILGNEAYLINANIPAYQFARSAGYDPKRSRKILLHKKELLKLKLKMTSGGLTMAPKACYNKGPLIKLEVALVKGRGDIGKKAREKDRDVSQKEKREAKEYLKY